MIVEKEIRFLNNANESHCFSLSLNLMYFILLESKARREPCFLYKIMIDLSK